MSTPADAGAPGLLVIDPDRPRAPGPRPVVDVAVGVLIDAAGRLLLTTRPPGKAYAGYWEFPGGKIEPGETLEQALRRELQEEIGVTIGAAHPWRVLHADYPHARVCLQVCCVYDWHGALHMHEGQRYAWQTLPVTVAPILPGTVPLLDALAHHPPPHRPR
ncbi:CTP pyrophosphohydrolase [Tepidimonas thermarum]|uniref:8-oxo-dGTP diphosphatase n=1 Tax=Tepidimonas thermarum TaxID=335431 RepID=A0A554X325_9BURK|nr:CTP pyrophosphohydrolase [Tepidimonas thermarum]